MPAADAALAPRVTRALLEEVLAQVPDDWLEDGRPARRPRERYVAQLLARLARAGRLAARRWSPRPRPAGGGRRRAPRGENRPAWLGPPPPEGVTQR